MRFLAAAALVLPCVVYMLSLSAHDAPESKDAMTAIKTLVEEVEAAITLVMSIAGLTCSSMMQSTWRPVLARPQTARN
ncbi:hypothetical protein BH24PSE2_BH24PSE2_18090 [soil metagenome]